MSEARADMATPTEPAPETPEADTATPDFSTLADLGLTLEQIQGRLEASSKWEKRAKANAEAARELERIQREALPEQERLVAEAKASARADLLSEFGAERVESAIRLAVGDRTDVDALLEGLDTSRFLTEDGKADTAAISAWVDRIAPQAAETPETPASPWGDLDLGQGARSQTPLGSDPLLALLKNTVGG